MNNTSDTPWHKYDKGDEKPRRAYLPQICYIAIFICIKTKWRTVLHDLSFVKHVWYTQQINTNANQWICKSAKTKPHLQEYSLLEGIREIHGIILLSIIFFKHLTNTASDTSVLNPSPYIWFQIRAPRYLIPVFPKSDLTAGMCKWQAALILWSWISLFSWKKCDKYIWNITCVVFIHETTNQVFIYIVKFHYSQLII